MMSLIESFASDYFASVGLPVASGAAAAGSLVIQQVLRKRVEVAREILLDELRRGVNLPGLVSEDDAAAVVFRYMRSAQEGAARLNLRLLAAVISGKASSNDLTADEFLRWAGILEDLRREEILLLGVFSKLQVNPPPTTDGSAPPFIVWAAAKRELELDYGLTDEQTTAAAYALLRTGLVVMVEGVMKLPMLPAPSTHLAEIRSIMSIEGVLSRE